MEEKMKRAKTVAFITLGCKTNQYETDGMAQQMREAGYDVLTSSDCADVTVINTCAVTNIAERKSRQMIRKIKKANPDTILVAAGCYIQNAQAVLEELNEVDLFLGNNQKQYLATYLAEYEKTRESKVHVIDINHTSEYEAFTIDKTEQNTRAYIKIQDGCNQFCSYCIIPYVRGRVRSRDAKEIVMEAEALAKDGYKEIVLTGIHIGSYGMDFDETLRQDALLHLLVQLHEIDGLERIRLGSLEPRTITETFVSTISNMYKICPHFHLSLQSGCDETLQRMNRKYTSAEYKDACEMLRRYYSHPAITTDVIVGFPGETAEEFETTYRYLEELQLYETHVFKYSVRKGTNAEKFPNQIDGTVKQMRSERLLHLHQKNKEAYEGVMQGQESSVLFEEIKKMQGCEYLVGHTPNYVKVAIPCETLGDTTKYIGEIVDVKLGNTRVDEYLNAHLQLKKT